MTGKQAFESILKYLVFFSEKCDSDICENEKVLETMETVNREMKVLETIKDIYENKIMTDTKKIIERYEMKNNAYSILGDEKYKPSNLLESDYRKAKLLKEWLGNES